LLILPENAESTGTKTEKLTAKILFNTPMRGTPSNANENLETLSFFSWCLCVPLKGVLKRIFVLRIGSAIEYFNSLLGATRFNF